MKVLLADDNPFILEHFTKMIDWQTYGFETVLSAVDGKKAWLEFDRHHPELVITDIQMPKMTGIELAQKIVDTSPETIIFFLTSYEEFSYVKSALDLNVYGYLLKHETKKEKLIEILEKVKLEIKRRKLNSKYTADASFRAFLHELEEEPISSLAEYEISLPDRYDLLMLEQNHIYSVIAESFALTQEVVSEKKMIKLCSTIMPNLTAIAPLAKYQFLLLTKSTGSVTESAYQIKQSLFQQLHIPFSILVIADNVPILSCAEQFRKWKNALQQTFFYPKSSVIYAEYLNRSRTPRSHFDLPPLSPLMEEKRFDEISRLIDQHYISCIESRDYRRFEELTRAFVSVMLRYDRKIVDVQTGASFCPCDSVTADNWYDATSIYQWLKYKFAELARILSATSISQYSDLVQNAISYVNHSYADCSLGIDMIADHLRISSNRLNTIFKKETGETLGKLIIKVRMEKAKELLNANQYKVSDICRMTGFNSLSYFSKVFRETYGLTPLEYRRKVEANLSFHP